MRLVRNGPRTKAGVNLHDPKVLMNHALPNGYVTMGYLRVSVEHLRTAAEKNQRLPGREDEV